MRKTNTELLKERIEQNYDDFRAKTLLMGEKDIFDVASRIAVVEDTYYQMTEYDYVDEDEAGYLLTFHNPLEMIADFLECLRSEEPVDVDEALFELFEQEDNEDHYLTAELAEELKQKYGVGTNIRLALLSEAVDAGNRFIRLRRLIDSIDCEGVDYCLHKG